jgi:hypothetical protein
MPWQYSVTKDVDGSFGADGVLHDDAVRQFRSVSGLATEEAARQWVYEQQARDAAEGS